jgi:hypothetical protein
VITRAGEEHAAVVECIQPLAERRCQHPALASVGRQVEHEGAVQLALDTSGSERGPKALAADPIPQTAECGRCGSEPLRDLVVVREGGGRDGAEVPKLLRERDDAERVVDLERERVVGCWSVANLRVETSLSLPWTFRCQKLTRCCLSSRAPS